MTKKDQLQKEIKEKVKPGIKPSDLKKAQKQAKENKSPSPMSINKDDEGYISDEEEKSTTSTPTASTLPNQKVKDLESQIKSLQTQIQTYKDFKEADLKIKEKYKQEIKQLKEIVKKSNTLIAEKEQIIKDLQQNNQSLNKTIEKSKNKQENKEINKEPVNKNFFCDGCQLTKQGNYTKRKVDAPFEPRLHARIVYLCSSCSPYYKELNDATFDKDNNPYKIY